MIGLQTHLLTKYNMNLNVVDDKNYGSDVQGTDSKESCRWTFDD